MQRLEVSGAVEPIYGSLGVKRLKTETCRRDIIVYFDVNLKLLTKLINSAFVGV